MLLFSYKQLGQTSINNGNSANNEKREIFCIREFPFYRIEGAKWMFRKKIEELERDRRDKLVVDLREPEEYEKETYPGAVNMTGEKFDTHIAEIPTDKPVYLMCHTGEQSDVIAERLKDKGYESYSVEGGYRSYLRQKLEVLMEE